MTLTAFFCCSFGLILLKKTTNPAKRSWVYLNEKVKETYIFFALRFAVRNKPLLILRDETL